MALLWLHMKPCDMLWKARLGRQRGRWWTTLSSEATFHEVQRNDGKVAVPLPCPSLSLSSFIPPLSLSGSLDIERGLSAIRRLSDMNIKHTSALSCLKLSVPESISALAHLPCAAPPATLGTQHGLTAGPPGLLLLGPPHTHLSTHWPSPSLFATEGERTWWDC